MSKSDKAAPYLYVDFGEQDGRHQLAQETHRSEAEIIHEALAGYLAADRRYVEGLTQRIAAADNGEFASAEEIEAFFDVRGLKPLTHKILR